MFMNFTGKYPILEELWNDYKDYHEHLELPAKHVFIKEGHITDYYYYIESGAVRAYFLNKDGVDKSVQFFFEGHGLSSFESFMKGMPSEFNVETLEPTTLTRMPKEKIIAMLNALGSSADSLAMIIDIFSERQIHYMHEFASFLKDSPQQRYENLLLNRPRLLQRVPQHYIASYLGVSAVHLSRIKAKVAKK